MSAESDQGRRDRDLEQLLEELRVAIPGVEVLFAVLLGVAFTQRFETLTSMQRSVYFGMLLSTAAATALLIAPSAYHRLNFRQNNEEQMLFTATHLAVAGLVLITLSVSGVVFMVADLMFGAVAATTAAASLAGWFAWFWFALPSWRRRRQVA